MEKNFAFVAASVLLLSASAPAATRDMVPLTTTASSASRSSVVGIRFQTLPLAVGLLQGDIEFPVSSRITLGPAGSLLLNGMPGKNGERVEATLNNVGVRASISLTGEALQSGFFFAPQVAYVFGGMDMPNAPAGVTGKATMTGISIAGTVGYQYVANFGLTFRLGAGVRYQSIAGVASVSVGGLTRSEPTPPISVVGPEIDLALGWVF